MSKTQPKIENAKKTTPAKQSRAAGPKAKKQPRQGGNDISPRLTNGKVRSRSWPLEKFSEKVVSAAKARKLKCDVKKLKRLYDEMYSVAGALDQMNPEKKAA